MPGLRFQPDLPPEEILVLRRQYQPAVGVRAFQSDARPFQFEQLARAFADEALDAGGNSVAVATTSQLVQPELEPPVAALAIQGSFDGVLGLDAHPVAGLQADLLVW